MNSKNILVITTVSGFLSKFELNNVKTLIDMGHKVHYASNMNNKIYDFNENDLTDMGIVLHDICIAKSPYDLMQNFKALLQILRIIENDKIDIIHCHTPVGGLLGRLACKFSRNRKLKVIYTAHGFHFYRDARPIQNFIFRTIEKYLAHYTDVIVLINHEDYAAAKKFRLRQKGRVYKIPGTGLDMNRYKPFDEDQVMRMRMEYNVEKDQFCLVSVGELNDNKNHATIIKALIRMREAGYDLNRFRYLIFGKGPNKEKLQTLIESGGLEKCVTLCGYSTRIEQVLACADLFLFPSVREGMGMAALEALACGIPVVAADNRGSREYILPSVNGFSNEPMNIDAYIENIRKIKDMSLEERSEMAKNCRLSVEKFDARYADLIMKKVYRDICD